MTTQDPKSSDWGSFECLTSIPQGQKLRQEVTLDAGGFQGGQTQFAVSAKLDPRTVAEDLASDISGCEQGPDFKVSPRKPGGPGSSGPYRTTKIFSYTAGDAGSGWFAVVPGPSDVTLIQVADAANKTSRFTLEQVTDLAQVAKDRLTKYGSRAAPTTPSTTTGTGSGPKAINEKMTVTGPDPVPSSDLFVAASQWGSSALTGGAKTSAGPGALEGSTAIVSCETDDQQAGVGGQVGVVSVRTGSGSATYLGHQRVQLDEATEPAVQKAYVQARLTEARALYAKGCSFPNGTVRSVPGASDGTYRLDTVFSDGTPTQSQWVGVTTQETPGAVSTIVITKASDSGKGFAELDRLLALARQK
jgi:hypothetical protein